MPIQLKTKSHPPIKKAPVDFHRQELNFPHYYYIFNYCL